MSYNNRKSWEDEGSVSSGIGVSVPPLGALGARSGSSDSFVGHWPSTISMASSGRAEICINLVRCH